MLICKSHSVSDSFKTYRRLPARGADNGATRQRSINKNSNKIPHSVCYHRDMAPPCPRNWPIQCTVNGRCIKLLLRQCNYVVLTC